VETEAPFLLSKFIFDYSKYNSTNMTFQDLYCHLKTAAVNGTIMTPKHDPSSLGTSFSRYRSVLSNDLANNLENFITTGDYTVKEFENTRMPSSNLYFEIVPNPSSNFNIPASGVTANSIFATSALDRIIAVSGATLGWHIFGESSIVIQSKANNGDLIFKTNL
jgi:hypothetical protein